MYLTHIISDQRKEQIRERLRTAIQFRGANTQEITSIFLDELNKEVQISLGDTFLNEIKEEESKEFAALTPRQIKSREGRTEVVFNGNTVGYRHKGV